MHIQPLSPLGKYRGMILPIPQPALCYREISIAHGLPNCRCGQYGRSELPEPEKKESTGRIRPALHQTEQELFFMINRACLSYEIGESELFGHESGEFGDTTLGKHGFVEGDVGRYGPMPSIGALRVDVPARPVALLNSKIY